MAILFPYQPYKDGCQKREVKDKKEIEQGKNPSLNKKRVDQ